MELLQKIDLNSVDSGPKRLEKSAREKSSNEVSATQDKPFKEQLSEQTDQLNSRMNTKKTNENQKVNEAQSADVSNEIKDVESTVDAQVELGRATIEDKMLPLNTHNAEAELDALTLPVVAAPLVDVGKSLPLSERLIENITMKDGFKPTAESLSSLANSVKVADKLTAAEVELRALNLNQNSNKIISNLSNTEISNTTTESVQQKPLFMPPNLSERLSEKANMQDAKMIKMASDVSTTELISQASRLQQVPVTTAVTASVTLAQNVLAAEPVLNTNALSQTNTLTNTTLSPLNTSISVNVANQNWSQQMTQQVSYMVKGGFQQAEIKLNPAHLGPMEIKLSIKDDQASVNFVTQHAAVRDALDAALPRLKEMLEQQGLNLADADVSTQSEQRQASSETQQDSDDVSAEGLSHADLENITPESEDGKLTLDTGVSIFA